MGRIKDLNKDFEEKKKASKEKIKQEPNKFKRFWKWVLYLIVFPFKWLWYNIRDWRTAVIFIITVVVVSSEVWVPYLLGFIFYANETLRITMFSVGSACWLFWLGPGTPFMVICIVITIAIKGVFNKIKYKHKEKKMMNFGKALEALKEGKKVRRKGWNGKGLWLELQVPDAYSKMTLPYVYLNYPPSDAYHSGCRVPWLASQTDMLEEDWEIVE